MYQLSFVDELTIDIGELLNKPYIDEGDNSNPNYYPDLDALIQKINVRDEWQDAMYPQTDLVF